VRGIDLEVARGEIFAFLGPNGAGKTTTVEILEGFRRPTHGRVTVLGVDPTQADGAWRNRVGVVLQESQPEPGLTLRERADRGPAPSRRRCPPHPPDHQAARPSRRAPGGTKRPAPERSPRSAGARCSGWCRCVANPAAPARMDNHGCEASVHYEIRVQGLLDQRWSSWFDGLTVTSQPDSATTLIAGPVADQAALHGLLAKIRDLGLPLISVRRIDPQ
jgi:ABC-type Fe3+/spermidine/putrescine transport system ATPase subunit